jgi:hypothetical protein
MYVDKIMYKYTISCLQGTVIGITIKEPNLYWSPSDLTDRIIEKFPHTACSMETFNTTLIALFKESSTMH